LRLCRLVTVACLAACGAISLPGSAAAAICGTKDAGTDTTLRGVLALDETDAVTDVAFKRQTGHKPLPLVFKVNGCELADDAAAPRLAVKRRKGIDALPAKAISIESVEPDGSTLDVNLDVDLGKFGPGSYGASIVLRAPYMNSSRTPISVSRSESSSFIPAGVGALGALAGLFVFTLLQIIRSSVQTVTKPVILILVGLVAIAAGALLGYVSYQDQDVWKFSDNWVATATAGFGGATGGVMTGLLGGIWKDKK